MIQKMRHWPSGGAILAKAGDRPRFEEVDEARVDAVA
jgi:hypothetical protein